MRPSVTSDPENQSIALPLPAMSSETLQNEVDRLWVEAEYRNLTINQQEQDLIMFSQMIVNLVETLKTADVTTRPALEAQLSQVQTSQKRLQQDLANNRKALQTLQSQLNQHWRSLQPAPSQALDQPQFPSLEEIAPIAPVNSPEPPARPLRLVVSLAIAGLLLTGASFLYASQRLSRPLPSSSPSVAQTPSSLPQSVAALGYLEPQGEVITLSAPAVAEGTRVEQLLVKIGQQVKAGEVIATLDNRERLQAALEQAKTQIGIAEARLNQVKAGAKSGDINAQKARFDNSKAELEGQIAVQQANIAQLTAQLKGEQTVQQATLERFKAELQNAQRECQRYQRLYQDGAVSVQERDRVCLENQTLSQQLKEAQANLERIIITWQEKLKESRANLARTITTLEQKAQENQSTLTAIAEVRPVDVQLAQVELAAAQADFRKAEKDLALAYVRSPQAAQVLKINTRPGEIVGREGIVELGQTQQMYVKAEVYETDISRVQVGQSATIKSDGVVEELQGTVEEIGLKIGQKKALGTDPAGDADGRVVDVKIRLHPEDSQRVAELVNLEVNVIIKVGKTALP